MSSERLSKPLQEDADREEAHWGPVNTEPPFTKRSSPAVITRRGFPLRCVSTNLCRWSWGCRRGSGRRYPAEWTDSSAGPPGSTAGTAPSSYTTAGWWGSTEHRARAYRPSGGGGRGELESKPPQIQWEHRMEGWRRCRITLNTL